jgi:ribosome biogenesis GTPase
MDLETIGWSPTWENAFESANEVGGIPARVIREHKELYELATEMGEAHAEVSGRFLHHTHARDDFPAVGDWVVAERTDASSRAIIHAVLPRYSAFIRKVAGGRSEKQVVAANVDTVFLVSGLDNDFNLRRIERYLTLAYESGADPVIILNKADLHDNPEQTRLDVESVAYGVPIHIVSATTGYGLDELRSILPAGSTGALLGSSGVGKSSLVNALLGQAVLKTAEVREDDSKGRHTTTHRELIPLPGGAVLIDTPGMRELQLVGDDSSLGRSFDEIADLAEDCRYADCTHTEEPGCVVRAAVDSGDLDIKRYESYLQQRKEMLHHQVEQDIHLQKKEKRRWKAIYKSMKHHPKRDNRR